MTKARLVASARITVPEGTYVELVASLFTTLLTAAIMAISFVAVALIIAAHTDDLWVDILAVLGSVAVTARLTVLIAFRDKAKADGLAPAEARTLEHYFAATYLGFAAVFGAYSARAFWVADARDLLLVIGLLFGYGAGVAAGVALRPRIATAAIVIAVVPTIVTAGLMANLGYGPIAGLLTLFLAGGISSIRHRYRRAAESITMRRMFASLARSDALTGLPNRLALAERFAKLARVPDQGLAVHCLDLDRFKPVNDRYGHPVGDQLLHAVAQRLEGILRGGDFAARTGGDEFVVVQSGVVDRSEAELLARRIVRALSQPFRIGGKVINIGTSVGFALSSDGSRDLEQLIRQADDALLRAKHGGGGATVGFGLKQAG